MSHPIEILQKYTTPSGAQFILICQEKHPFEFKIVNPRNTKLGDYSYNFITNHHKITINNDLAQDAFLFTTIHEIAHHWVQLKHGNKVEPHGKEWKEMYRFLLLEAIKLDAFLNPVLILDSIDNIKSSSVYQDDIYRQLYAKATEDETFLDSLKNGDDFIFNDTLYKKIELRRSRVLSLNLENNKQYLISKRALVMKIED